MGTNSFAALKFDSQVLLFVSSLVALSCAKTFAPSAYFGPYGAAPTVAAASASACSRAEMTGAWRSSV